MPIIWGRWYSEEEVQQMADELNKIGRNLEEKTKGVANWIKEAKELQKSNPKGLVF